MEVPSLIRGTISDRPWGITLAALGLDERTCQLTLADVEGREYRIVFVNGLVIAASSPLVADSPLRVALTTKLVTPAQATELKKRLQIAPDLDEVSVIAATLRWGKHQEIRLRRDVIMRAAARTFAIERGTYVLEDWQGMIGREIQVDVRTIVYLGVRTHLSDERLAYDLRQLGTWFVLKPKTTVDVSGFGFGDPETPILDALRGGTNLATLEAKHRDVVDPRRAQAVLYALAVCDAVVCCEPPPERHAPIPPNVHNLDTVEVPLVSPDTVRMKTEPPAPPAISRAPTPTHPILADGSKYGAPRPPSAMPTSPWGHPIHDRTTAPRGVPVVVAQGNESSFVEVKTTTVRPNALAKYEVEQLIAQRTKLLDRGADHFALLGVPHNASTAEVRAAYVELARYLEPKQLAALGIRDEHYAARRLFAQICIAVTVLTDPIRRRDYLATLRRHTESRF